MSGMLAAEEKKQKIAELLEKRMEFMRKSQTLEEVEALREAAKLTEEVYGVESDENIKILNELGGTLKYISAFDEAEKALIKAREIIKKRYGIDSIPYATCNLNLAEVYRFMKKFNEIEPLYLESMKIYENHNFENNYEYASICNNLGLFYQEIGQFEKALELHKKSLKILETMPEYKLQYATTLSNMLIPYSKVGDKEKSDEYLEKSLSLIEKEVGKEHNLYSASLNNLAVSYFNDGELEKALKLFEESAEICKKSFGEESNNYKNLKSNVDFVKETLEKKEAILKSKSQNMKGLELARLYFEKMYLPVLRKEYPELLKRLAVGLVGEGSECFGYDDEISRDHDFGPSCCIWMSDSDYEMYGEEVSKRLDKLPKEFMGFTELNQSEWASNRRGVLNISDWYYKFLGKSSLEEKIKKIENNNVNINFSNEIDGNTELFSLSEWREIPETGLATATNGEIFIDNLGIFSKIRENLLNYYPEDIRKNKIATRCMKIAQSGQYNYSRCMKRNDIVAAKLAEAEFIQEVIHLVYLLNRKYVLFYKWSYRGLLDLPILGSQIHKLIGEISERQIHDKNGKVFYIEEICSLLIQEIKRQNLLADILLQNGITVKANDIKSNFLQDYGLFVQASIENDELKKLPPMVD